MRMFHFMLCLSFFSLNKSEQKADGRCYNVIVTIRPKTETEAISFISFSKAFPPIIVVICSELQLTLYSHPDIVSTSLTGLTLFCNSVSSISECVHEQRFEVSHDTRDSCIWLILSQHCFWYLRASESSRYRTRGRAITGLPRLHNRYCWLKQFDWLEKLYVTWIGSGPSRRTSC